MRGLFVIVTIIFYLMSFSFIAYGVYCIFENSDETEFKKISEYLKNYEMINVDNELYKSKEIIKKLLDLYFTQAVTQDDLKKRDEIIKQAREFVKE